MNENQVLEYVAKFFTGTAVTYESQDKCISVSGLSLHPAGHIVSNAAGLRFREAEYPAGISGPNYLFVMPDTNESFLLNETGNGDLDGAEYVEEHMPPQHTLASLPLSPNSTALKVIKSFINIFEDVPDTQRWTILLPEKQPMLPEELRWRQAIANLFIARGTCGDGPVQAMQFLMGKDPTRPLPDVDIRAHRSIVNDKLAPSELPPVWREQFRQHLAGQGSSWNKNASRAAFVFEETFPEALS